MRQTTLFIPYYIKDNKLFVMLQLRSKDMERIPGYLSFFGGGLDEGETPEQGLLREVKEELDYDLKIDQVQLFLKYEFYNSINYAYLFKTESEWTPPQVLEGEAAVWMNSEAVFDKPNVLFKDKTLINDLERFLLKKPIR
jgi:8-oxo-dGTP pyrophosphatase MutT (NUDIX family)